MSRYPVWLVLLFSLNVQASGRLPEMPMPPQQFAQFSACLADLKRRYAEDLEGVDAKPRPMDGGTIRQSLESEGVQLLGKNSARYNAEIGWYTRRVDGQWAEYNYTWERHDLRCDAGTLSGVNSGGYHLPSRVPLATDSSP